LVKRLLVLLVFVAIGSVAAASVFADQVNGNGQTPLSASLGFNAKSDLSGQLNYNADPQGPFAGFSAHCDGFTSFKLKTSGDGFPKVIVTATCTDQDDVTVYLKAQFTDRGEPGQNDSVCITWGYTSPVTHKNAFIHDHGLIQSGNIQIHIDENGAPTAEMLVEQ
jgi:hypothetical protein